EVFVDDDTVLDAQSGVLRELHARAHTDPDDYEIRRQAFAALQNHRVALNLRGRLLEMEADTVLLVQRLDEGAEITAHDTLEWQRFGRHDVHRELGIPRAERCRNLQADERGADDDRMIGAAGGFDDGTTVTQRPQIFHVGLLTTG